MQYRIFITLVLIGTLGLVGCRTSGSWTSKSYSTSAFNPANWSFAGPGSAPSQVAVKDAPAFPEKPSVDAVPTGIDVQTGTTADASALSRAGASPNYTPNTPAYPTTNMASPVGYAGGSPDPMSPQAGPYGAELTPYPQVASNPNGHYPATGGSYSPAGNSYQSNPTTTPSYAYPGTNSAPNSTVPNNPSYDSPSYNTPSASSNYSAPNNYSGYNSPSPSSYATPNTAPPVTSSTNTYQPTTDPMNSVTNPYRGDNTPPATNSYDNSYGNSSSNNTARFTDDPNSRYYNPSASGDPTPNTADIGTPSSYSTNPTEAMSTTPGGGYDYSSSPSSSTYTPSASSYSDPSNNTPGGFRPGSTSTYPSSGNSINTTSGGYGIPAATSAYGAAPSGTTTNYGGYDAGSSYGTAPSDAGSTNNAGTYQPAATPNTGYPDSTGYPSNTTPPMSSGYPASGSYTPSTPSYTPSTPSYTPSSAPTSSYGAPAGGEVIPTSYNNTGGNYIR